MIQPTSAASRPRLTGVIDTLSDGYGVVNRHPWILLFPVLLDVLLWFGPQLSVARLLSQTAGLLTRPGRADQIRIDEAQLKDVIEMAEGFNLLSALAPSFIGIPSRVAVVGIRDPLRSLQVETWGATWLVVMLCTLLGLLLGALYYEAIANQVRQGAESLSRMLLSGMRGWGRALAFLLLLFGLGILLGLPLMFLSVGAAMLSDTLGNLVASLSVMGIIWAWIYLYFVPYAIFVSEVGPLQAIKNSVAVVRHWFWTALTIMLLMGVVLAGMTQIWSLANALGDPWGTGLGILGNAYIASGLIAASMRFYRERIEFLRGQVAPSAPLAATTNG